MAMSFIYCYIMPSKYIIDIMKVSFYCKQYCFLRKFIFVFFLSRTPNNTWIFPTNMVESKRNFFYYREFSLNPNAVLFIFLKRIPSFFYFFFRSLEVFSIKFFSFLSFFLLFCWKKYWSSWMQWGIDKKIIKIENYRRLMEWGKLLLLLFSKWENLISAFYDNQYQFSKSKCYLS